MAASTKKTTKPKKTATRKKTRATTVKRPPRELVSGREYARRRPCAHTTVQDHIRLGHLSTVTVGKRKMIDPVVADREWAKNIDQSKPRNTITGDPKHRRKAGAPSTPMDLDAAGKKTDGGNGHDLEIADVANYSNARAAREVYLAKIAELDWREREGSLVSADEIKIAAFNEAKRVREQLVGLPDRLSIVLAGIDEPHEIRRLLDQEIEQICEELSGAKRR